MNIFINENLDLQRVVNIVIIIKIKKEIDMKRTILTLMLSLGLIGCVPDDLASGPKLLAQCEAQTGESCKFIAMPESKLDDAWDLYWSEY